MLCLQLPTSCCTVKGFWAWITAFLTGAQSDFIIMMWGYQGVLEEKWLFLGGFNSKKLMTSKAVPSLWLSGSCKFREWDSQAVWELKSGLYNRSIDETLGERTRAILFELGMEVSHLAGRRASGVEDKAQSNKDNTHRLWLALKERDRREGKGGS